MNRAHSLSPRFSYVLFLFSLISLLVFFANDQTTICILKRTRKYDCIKHHRTIIKRKYLRLTSHYTACTHYCIFPLKKIFYSTSSYYHFNFIYKKPRQWRSLYYYAERDWKFVSICVIHFVVYLSYTDNQIINDQLPLLWRVRRAKHFLFMWIEKKTWKSRLSMSFLKCDLTNK